MKQPLEKLHCGCCGVEGVTQRCKPFIMTEVTAQCYDQGAQEILGCVKRNMDSKCREGIVLLSAMFVWDLHVKV